VQNPDLNPIPTKKKKMFKMWSQAWWHIPVIPALGRLRQKHQKFEASVGYISKSLSQKNPKTNT
jgi:hypothetical protein